MVGPLEPAGLNFVGLASGGPNVVTGASPQAEPDAVENRSHPVAGTGDLVEISPEAENAARAVRPAAATSTGPAALSPAGAGAAPVPGNERVARGEQTPPDERERQAAIEAARVNAEASRTPVEHVRSVGVRFNFNRDLNRAQVAVVDRQSREVIREVPPEARIRIAERLQETLQAIQDVGSGVGSNVDESA